MDDVRAASINSSFASHSSRHSTSFTHALPTLTPEKISPPCLLARNSWPLPPPPSLASSRYCDLIPFPQRPSMSDRLTHRQIINAATLLMHSVFLNIWWQKQSSSSDSACFRQLVAFSTFVGFFALIVASFLQIKRLARMVSPMVRIGMDGLVATFCVAGGSVSAYTEHIDDRTRQADANSDHRLLSVRRHAHGRRPEPVVPRRC